MFPAPVAPSGLFSEIVGQDLVVVLLQQDLAIGAVHAYLFTGPPGVGKSEASLAFAAGLACADRGCGLCDTCWRVLAGIHPDVEVITPEGTNILIDQIRELNSEVAWRPFEGQVRVYLILEAETMNKEAANALLKTLEEPPPHSHLILVTDRPEALLPTIVSRCRKVVFRPVPVSVLASHLQKRYGISAIGAQAFARVAEGNLDYACELASDPDARAQRELLVGWARRIPEGDLLSAERMVDEILDLVEARAAAKMVALEAQRERDLEWAGDARSRGRVERNYEARRRREHRRAVTRGVEEVISTFASWYRDLAVAAAGAPQTVLNYDYLNEIERESFPSRLNSYLCALAPARRARLSVRYNVEARLMLLHLILAMKEALV